MKYFFLFSVLFCTFSFRAQFSKLDSLNKALKNAKHDTVIAQTLYEIAKIYLKNNPDTVDKLSQKAFEISKKNKYKRGMCDGYAFFAYRFFLEKNFELSLQNYEKNIELKRQMKDLRGEAITLSNMAELYSQHKLYDKNLECMQRSLDIYCQLNDLFYQGVIYNQMGVFYLRKANEELAKIYFEKSDSVSIIKNKPDARAENFLGIGQYYFENGNYKQAGEYYFKSLQLLDEKKIIPLLGSVYGNIGYTYYHLGEHEKAIKYCNASLKIANKLNLMRLCMKSNLYLGNVYTSLSNYPKAIEHFNKQLKIAGELNDRLELGNCLNSLGLVYRNIGDLSKAIECLKQANIHIISTHDKPGIAGLQNNLGQLLTEKGDLDESHLYLKQSLTMAQEINHKGVISACLHNLAIVHQRKLNYDSSLYYLERSRELKKEIGDKVGVANSLQNSAALYFGTDRYEKCREFAELALSQGKDLKIPELKRRALKTLGNLELRLENLDEAENLYNQIIEIDNTIIRLNFATMSEKEKDNLFKQLLPDFEGYNSLCLKAKHKKPELTGKAYNYAIRNKGLLLRSSTAMRRIILESKDTALISRYTLWLETKKQIGILYSKGKDTGPTEEKANELEKELVKKSTSFGELDKVLKITWQDVQKQLKPNEVAIEFINFYHENVGEKFYTMIYCALVVKPGYRQPEMIPLFKEKELIKVLGGKAETGESYITRVYGSKGNENIELFNLIWKPLEKTLGGVKKIYYSPSGLLHKISFAAISLGQSMYLCDKFRLELQGSTSGLCLQPSVELDAKSQICIFGDINYDTPFSLADTSKLVSWSYLEGTKTESEKVSDILSSGGFSVNFMRGDSAGEKEFKARAPESNIVHIATHGFFFPEPKDYFESESKTETRSLSKGERAIGVYNFVINKNPLMRSGLVFSGANDVWVRQEITEKEDGVLTAQEVAGMDLRKTKLVVLSACETGLGDIKGIEGVYGLQRSLKMAGVRNIIMSLWQVPDAETSEFMQKFYSRFVITQNLKDSFYSTRNELRKKYDAFYWAAFVLLE